jgi:hypothetical protein
VAVLSTGDYIVAGLFLVLVSCLLAGIALFVFWLFWR